MCKKINLNKNEVSFWANYFKASLQQKDNFSTVSKIIKRIIDGERIAGREYQDIKINVEEKKISLTILNCKNHKESGTECNSHIGILVGSIESCGYCVSNYQKSNTNENCFLTFEL